MVALLLVTLVLLALALATVVLLIPSSRHELPSRPRRTAGDILAEHNRNTPDEAA